MNTAQSIFESERQCRAETLRLCSTAAPGCDDPAFLAERRERLARQQRFFRLKNFLREHAWELHALVVFFLLIGVAAFFMSRTLAELDRVHELQREIELLRALAS